LLLSMVPNMFLSLSPIRWSWFCCELGAGRRHRWSAGAGLPDEEALLGHQAVRDCRRMFSTAATKSTSFFGGPR
jgi:hypothetical protein